MTQREAKIEALRCSVGWLNAMQTDYEDQYTPEEIEKIYKEKKKIIESLRKRAVRVGGDFNQYTGY